MASQLLRQIGYPASQFHVLMYCSVSNPYYFDADPYKKNRSDLQISLKKIVKT